MPKKITTKEFIHKAKLIHGFRYDYSKTVYIHSQQKLFILCPDHGIFEQLPYSHLRGQGCSKCRDIKFSNQRRMNVDIFMRKANQIHNNKYNYSKTIYKGCFEKVCIICPEHGEFWQTPSDHQKKHGCPICAIQRRTTNINNFIKQANQIHDNKYDYSKVEYINNKTKVCIICPLHGIFKQSPSVHINDKCGCFKCYSSKGETKIEKWLIENNIQFIPQYRFNECRNIRPLPFDFYLPDYNICIEYDGEQHFKPVQFGNMSQSKSSLLLQKTQINDQIKTKFCLINCINLIRISYQENIKETLISILH